MEVLSYRKLIVYQKSKELVKRTYQLLKKFPTDERTHFGLYKSTALVVKGKFYLFYTARDNEDCHLNRLFMTTTDWQDLLNLMTKYK